MELVGGLEAAAAASGWQAPSNEEMWFSVQDL